MCRSASTGAGRPTNLLSRSAWDGGAFQIEWRRQNCSRPVPWIAVRGAAYQDAVVNRRFSIPSCLIFDSSVEAGIPSLAAAPRGPATLPSTLRQRGLDHLLLLILQRLRERTLTRPGEAAPDWSSQASSIENVSPLHRMTDRSTISAARECCQATSIARRAPASACRSGESAWPSSPRTA